MKMKVVVACAPFVVLVGCLAAPLGPSPDQPAAPTIPGTVSDLAIAALTDSSVTLTFTEVSDGTGQPAKYDVRYAAGPPISWGAGTIASQGTCASPVIGSAVGKRRSCSVLGLASGTPHSFEVVAFRGTLNRDAVFGGLSNVVTGETAGSTAPVASLTLTPTTMTMLLVGARQLTATLRDSRGRLLSGRTISWKSSDTTVALVSTTGLVRAGAAEGTATITATSEAKSDSARVTVVKTLPPTTYYSTNFADGTAGPLEVYAYGGGTCGPSTDFTDLGSTRSIKCSILSGTGAAALQAWFGHGKLGDLPKDPSLDQDLFEQVRFVLAPGAAEAIGSTACTSLNRNSQFKVHKSVYGQAGNAWNGWVMSDIGPCSGGNRGIISEPEMWNHPGAYDQVRVWPNTFPSLREGTVYDVVYRYHRYTAQACGTVAVWVNETKVMDSGCQSYIGTTNGSDAGLLFWDGAVYLQNGLGPYTVYTLFVQATNFPIGVATSSP
jgi:Big-like domain-containing protein